MTTLERLYPDYKILGLKEIFVTGKWYTSLATSKKNIIAIAKRGIDGNDDRKIKLMCLCLKSPCGEIVYPDLKPKELYS